MLDGVFPSCISPMPSPLKERRDSPAPGISFPQASLSHDASMLLIVFSSFLSLSTIAHEKIHANNNFFLQKQKRMTVTCVSAYGKVRAFQVSPIGIDLTRW